MSLGFPRNESFLLPWLWIGGLVVIDRLMDGLPSSRLARFVGLLVAVSLLWLVVRGRPSLFAVEIARFEAQSAAGPLFRSLRELDPERTWTVLPTEDTRYFGLIVEHYRRYGHRVRVVAGPPGEADVRVWRVNEEAAYGPFFLPEEFDRFELRVRLAEGLPLRR